MFQHAIVTFVAVFLAELPDKTMFATLLLSTHFRRKFPVWIGVTVGYSFHVVIAVIFGSALSRLPERPIQLLVGALAWTAASVILVAEFGDLTQLATAGFAARFDDPFAVACGAVLALSSVSGLAVLTGSWLTTKVPLRVIQRTAALLFFVIGATTLVTALV